MDDRLNEIEETIHRMDGHMACMVESQCREKMGMESRHVKVKGRNRYRFVEFDVFGAERS
jgi:hypothetical protein